MERCRVRSTRPANRRLQRKRAGAPGNSRAQVVRGLLWVPDERAGEVRGLLAPAGGRQVSACCDRSDHERLAATVHLCRRWWDCQTLAGAPTGRAELVAVVASALSDTSVVVWRPARRRKNDSPAPGSDMANGAERKDGSPRRNRPGRMTARWNTIGA